MKSFARTTKLPSIGGRAAYISDPGKQEEIVLESEKVNWQPYADYEATQHKTNVRQNEGREVMVILPNSWYHLPKDELKNRIDTIAYKVVGDGRDYQWAIHWNKSRTNFHVHIIFSERQKTKDVKVWDRDIYLTSDGRVARKKSERARNEDGSFKPPIHVKGEVKSDPFTVKDTKFKKKEWLQDLKQDLKQTMEERWEVKFEKQPHLPEFHRGNGSDAPAISKKNIVVRENNRRLDFLQARGVNISVYIKEMKAARAAARTDERLKDQTPLLWQNSKGEYKVTVFRNPDRALFQMEQTMGHFQEQPVKAAENVRKAHTEPLAAAEQEQPVKAAETIQKAQTEPLTAAEQKQPEKAAEINQKAQTEPLAAEQLIYDEIQEANNAQLEALVSQEPRVIGLYADIKRVAIEATMDKAVIQFEVKNDRLNVTQIPYADHQQAKALETQLKKLESGVDRANELRTQRDNCGIFHPIKKKKLAQAYRDCVNENAAIRVKIEKMVNLPRVFTLEDIQKSVKERVDQLRHPEHYVESVADKSPAPDSKQNYFTHKDLQKIKAMREVNKEKEKQHKVHTHQQKRSGMER